MAKSHTKKRYFWGGLPQEIPKVFLKFVYFRSANEIFIDPVWRGSILLVQFVLMLPENFADFSANVLLSAVWRGVALKTGSLFGAFSL